MKMMCTRRFLLSVLVLVLGLVHAAVVWGETAPVGDKAYPPFGECSSSTPPDLPPFWQASVLLTPFQGSELVVAKVAYDIRSNAMRVTMEGLQSAQVQDTLIVGSRVFFIRPPVKGGGLSCDEVSNRMKWTVPAPDWLAEKGCKCRGSNSVVGQEAEAWTCPTGEEESVIDWFWFTKDEHRFPWRLLNSRQGVNAHHFPLLGDSSMAHLPEFEASVSPDLEAVVELCLKGTPTKRRYQQPATSIAGLSYSGCGSVDLPEWPKTSFTNGALFDIGGGYTNMAIYYDWNTKQEVSKIKYRNGTVVDDRLTQNATYTIEHLPNGETQCGQPLNGVGIWHPNWPSLDNCQCKGIIQPGSVLNPQGNAAVQAMTCHFGGKSNIQAWYSVQGKPVMFYETNAGALDLIDYYAYMPNATMPDGIFNEPSECMKPLPAPPHLSCNKCHDGE